MSASAASAAPVPAEGAPPAADKWIIAITVMVPAFMAVMDVSVVNVALPHMMGSFGQDLSAITWVATSYSIAEVIMLTMAGWWSALLGRKRLFMASLLLFTLGSILAGTATTFTQMIVYRILQGIGGGSLIPLSQAILRETFPAEQQGMAMAIYGMGVVLAPATGPVLGGWLTDHYGWAWIFYINVPVSVLGLLLVGAYVHDPAYLKRGVKSIDWAGIALLSVSLTTLQILLERGQEENWFESGLIVACALVTGVSFVLLLVWELMTDEPIVDLRLLRNVPLAVGSAMGLVFGLALFGTTFILPQFTQELLGYSAFQSGLVLLPRAIALFICMPLAGWAYQRLDPRLLVLFGAGVIVWSYSLLAGLSLQSDFWALIPALVVMGVGMPFMFVTTSTVSLSTVPRAEMTSASSLYTLARRVGGNIGYAVVATLAAWRSQHHHARLAEHVTPENLAYAELKGRVLGALAGQALPPAAAEHAVHLIAEGAVSRHARLLAYNDVSVATGALFLIIVPLIFLLPGRARLQQAAQAAEH
ncbi:MAG: DHA2 family efflux MFS transporter permease subunit [Planctomycetota bacterium]